MNTVAVFGSGRVARPAIRTLLDTGHRVVVATDQPQAGAAMIDGHPEGRVVEVDARDATAVRAIVADCDAAMSLLPVSFHALIAEQCLAEKKHFVTTSYVSDEMRELRPRVEEAGLLFLNEVGADPGIDHMQAMRIIDRLRKEGANIRGFFSVCGGLPAPEANDNPFGYKISWSPRGVALAGSRVARFVAAAEIVVAGPFEIFDDPRTLEIEGVGTFEAYPNGDSTRFLRKYGLEDVRGMFRGSLRFAGWCATWSALGRLGWLETEPSRELSAPTYAAAAHEAAGGEPGESARAASARALGMDESDAVLDRLEWLGLFEDDPVPDEAASLLDLLVARMEERLRYREGERDMLVLYHEFEYEDASGLEHRLGSTMIQYGEPGGDTAMARCVGFPAAFALRRILDGTIPARGVRIPVVPEIYEPILADLKTVGIEETVEELTGQA